LIPKSFVHSRCGDCKSGVSAGMGSEEAWMWHHLNFLALRMLAQEDMVRGATGAGTCGSGLQWLPHWQAASHDVSSSSRALCRGTHGASTWGPLWADHAGIIERQPLLPPPRRRLQLLHVAAHSTDQGASGECHQAVPTSCGERERRDAGYKRFTQTAAVSSHPSSSPNTTSSMECADS
jgi:hypothetical protein